MKELKIDPPETIEPLVVLVRQHGDILDPGMTKMSFAVRMPTERWLQEVYVSEVRCKELLDRCWQVIRDRILAHYKVQERKLETE